jgi:EmrB/QacA subfamily drug resistance transporter
MTKPGFFSYDHPSYPLHITANVILTTFLAVVSAVSTMIADPSIQGELALSDTQSIWITTLYLLGINTVVPTGNWFANQFGANRMYTYGVVIFSLASLLAAVSSDFFMIASARFLEGVGAGFIFPIGLGLIVQSMPKEKIRLAVNMYIGIAFGLGLGLGVPLAGYFSQFQSWRDVFFLIVPIGALATVSCWLCRKPIPDTKKSSFDIFGFLTFFLFIASLLIALTMGPIPATSEGWRSPYIIVLFATAVLSLISCILIEKHHPNPLIPLALFKDPIFSVGLAAMFLLGMATFASVSVIIDYMIDGLFYEKYTTGKIAAVYGLTIGLFSIIASYISKIIPLPILTFSGLGLLIFSYFYNNELSWLTGYSQVITILLIRGVGIGLALGPTTILTLSGLPAELKSAGTTILTFFRQVGGTYGGTLIAIFSIRQTIFHTARFGEQASTQLPAYKMTFNNLYDKFPDAAQAKAAIVKNIATQAYIQGLNDALIVFGYVTGAVSLILMVMIGFRMWKTRRKDATS